MEIWKDIKGYEKNYQISNLGNVKSKGNNFSRKEKLLKQGLNKNGYLYVILCNGKNTHFYIHHLIAINFLNHNVAGRKFVINHIDFDKKNNKLINLEVVTNRENTSKKHLNSSSKYTGVYLNKRTGKWVSSIYIERKRKHLGYFINEYDAYLAYEKALKSI